MSRSSSYWLRYLGHLALIMAALFIAYPLGDAILSFQGASQTANIAKMYIWFLLVLFGADLLFERLLRV